MYCLSSEGMSSQPPEGMRSQLVQVHLGVPADRDMTLPYLPLRYV